MGTIADCKLELRQMFPDMDGEILDGIAEQSASIHAGKDIEAGIKELTARTTEKIEISHQNKIKDQLKVEEWALEFVPEIVKGPQQAHKALESTMTPSTSQGQNKFSLDGKMTSIAGTTKSFLFHNFQKENLSMQRGSALMSDPKNTGSIAEALQALETGKPTKGMAPDTVAVAKGMIATLDKIQRNLRASGVEMKTKMDHFWRQSHFPGKLGRLKPDEWAKIVINKLDMVKTFGAVNDKVSQLKILEDVYDGIMSTDYGGQGATAKGAKRTLYFKDAATFSDYHAEFGEGTMAEIMDKAIGAAARAEATYTTFGPGGRANYDKLEVRMGNEVEAKHGKRARAIFDSRDKAAGAGSLRDSLANSVFGHGKREIDGIWEEGNRLRKLIRGGLDFLKNNAVLSKLGMAITGTVNDLPIAVGKVMSSQGEPFFKTVTDLVSNFVKVAVNGKQRDTLLVMHGIQMEESLSRITGAANDNKVGKTFKHIMAATGLQAQSTIGRATTAKVIGHNVFEAKDLPFDELKPRMKAAFEDFKISSEDWDQIRTHGVDHAIKEVPGISSSMLDQMGVPRAIVNKYAAYMSHGSRFGAVSPDNKTKSVMNLGFDPSSTAGKFVSTSTLFTTFSAQMFRTIPEIIKSNPKADNSSIISALTSTTGNWKMMGQLTGLTMATTLVSMSIRDVLKGKTPRDFTKPEFWTENWVEFAGKTVMPLGGDYVLKTLSGEYDQFGKNPLTDLAGPVLGQIPDVAALVGAIATSDEKSRRKNKVSKKALRLAKGNIPGGNLWFLDVLLNMMIWNPLQDMIDPKARGRANKHMRETGQSRLFDR